MAAIRSIASHPGAATVLKSANSTFFGGDICPRLARSFTTPSNTNSAKTARLPFQIHPHRFHGRRAVLVQTRGFSNSTARRKTISLTEPRLDDDGKEMLLEITPRAAQRLSEIMKVGNDPGFALRIKVQSGGCHGFQYLTTNDSVGELSTLEEDECVLRFVDDDATEIDKSLHGPKIVLDEASLMSLQGSKVDYIQELIGSRFEVTDNPLAENSCGCGSSFSLKL